MPTSLVHTCLRVRDADASIRFYGALGFDVRGRLSFPSAYNVYLGLPGDGDRFELTVNLDRDAKYELGDGYSPWQSLSTTSTRRSRGWPSSTSSPSSRRTARAIVTICP